MQGGSLDSSDADTSSDEGMAQQVSDSEDHMVCLPVGAADLQYMNYQHTTVLTPEQTRNFLLEEVQVYRQFVTSICQTGCMLQECPLPVSCSRLQLWRLVVVWIAGVVLRDPEMLVEPRSMYPTDDDVKLAVSMIRFYEIKDIVDEFVRLYTSAYHGHGVFEWCCGYFSRDNVSGALLETLQADTKWQELMNKLNRARWHVIHPGNVYSGTHVAGLTVHDSHFHSMYVYLDLQLDDSLCDLTEADKLAIDTLQVFTSECRWVLMNMVTPTDIATWQNHMNTSEGAMLGVDWCNLLYTGASTRFLPLHMHGVSNPDFAPGGSHYEYWRAPTTLNPYNYYVPLTALFCGTGHSIMGFTLHTLHFLVCIEEFVEIYLEKEFHAPRCMTVPPHSSLLYHEISRLHHEHRKKGNHQQCARFQRMIDIFNSH